MIFKIITTICTIAIVILATIIVCILLIWGIVALICGLIDYLKLYITGTGLKRERTFSNYEDNDGAF